MKLYSCNFRKFAKTIVSLRLISNLPFLFLPKIKLRLWRMSLCWCVVVYSSMLFFSSLFRFPNAFAFIVGHVISTVFFFTKIFKDWPDSFFIGHYHSWYFDTKTFPTELIVDMKDEEELIMAFHHRYWDLTAIQFHPESIITEYGEEIIRNWLEQTVP